MRKLSHREVKSPASKCWFWDLNPGSLAPGYVILTTHDTASERESDFMQLIFLIAKVRKKSSWRYVYIYLRVCVCLTREIIC